MSWPSAFSNTHADPKKNDDRRPPDHLPPAAWQYKGAQPMRKRRVVYLFCCALFVYLFIKNLPTDVGPHPRWADARVYPGSASHGKITAPAAGGSAPAPPTKKPPQPATPPDAEEHYHDGPIKFYRLAASLHAVAKLGGQKDTNKNVLFAAASLKSVSELLPLACEMAHWDRNDVHLALMGRDDMDIQEIQDLNGLADGDCNIHWHDARPDFSRWSTDFRMESSVAAGLEHIQTFIRPQVVLIDDAKREEDFLVDAIREKTVDLQKPLIELPSSALDNLMWITRLDSTSLAAWPKVNIEIVIQALPGSSGSLVRLLKSLENADYFGTRRPHLTIDLPPVVDDPTAIFLEYFNWPPVEYTGVPQSSRLSLRHRIPRTTTTPEEASARLLESFWPKSSSDSHVLLLSPQIELSPLYFHYLFYAVLEYRHSSLARSSDKYHKIMGISLHIPDSHLDDKTKFNPPRSGQVKKTAGPFPDDKSPFLWQAPNNNAALYFGDKWKEFHSYLGLRLTKPPSDQPKKVSESHPAWMEHLLELMRIRSYSLLYPGAFQNEFTVTTVHDELFQVPEEFANKDKDASSSSASAPPAADTILEGSGNRTRKAPPNTERPLLEASLVDLLPNKADLLEVDKMPLLNAEGQGFSFKDANEKVLSNVKEFRQSTGGCTGDRQPPKYKAGQAVDLFCDPNEPYQYFKASDPVPPPEDKPKEEPKEEKPSDPDKITDADAERAKSEVSEHLERQNADEPPPEEKDSSPPKDDKHDKDDDKDDGPKSKDESHKDKNKDKDADDHDSPKEDEPPSPQKDSKEKKSAGADDMTSNMENFRQQMLKEHQSSRESKKTALDVEDERTKAGNEDHRRKAQAKAKADKDKDRDRDKDKEKEKDGDSDESKEDDEDRDPGW